MRRLSDWLATPEARWIIAIFALAFIVRLAFVGFLHPNPRDGRYDDSVFYDSAARHLAAGDGYVYDPTVWRAPNGSPIYPDQTKPTNTALWPPGYPVTLAVVYKITGNSLWSARLLNLLLASATAVLVFLIARKLFSLPVAATAGTALALFPSHIFFSAILLSETEFGFLLALILALCVYFVFGPRPPGILLAGALGVLIAFTGFVRGEFLAFGAVIALVMLIRYRLNSLMPIGALILGALLLIAPWVVRNAVQMDAAIAGTTGAGRVVYQAHNPNTNGGPSLDATLKLEAPYQGLPHTELEVKSNRDGTRLAREYAFSHIRRELQLFPKRLYLLFRSDESGVTWLQSNKPLLSQAGANRLVTLAGFMFFGFIALAVVSIAFWRRRGDPGLWLLFAVIPFYMLLFGVLFPADPRYHYALYLPLVIFGSVSLVEIWQMTVEHYRELRGGRVIATSWQNPAG